MSLTERYLLNEVVPINSQALKLDGSPELSADLIVEVRRVSDNFYWNGGSFVSGKTSVSMSEIGDVTAPGWWRYDFDTSGLTEDSYIAQVFDNSGNAANFPQFSQLIVGKWPQEIRDFAEQGAAASVGRVKYDPITSQLIVYAPGGPPFVELIRFDVKDVNGDPAGFNPEQFERIPV